MNPGYRQRLYAAADTARRDFPKDAVRRRQRYAQLLREQQGLEPSERELRALLAPVFQEAGS